MQFTRVDESREICDEINTPRIIFKPARRYKTKLKIGAASCVKAFVASCVPYVRINDRSLRVTERLSRASHSLTLSFSLPLSLSVFFFALLFRLSRSYQQSPHVVISDIQLIFQLVCFNIAGDVASYYSIKSFPFLQPALHRVLHVSHTSVPSRSRQKATIVARKNCPPFLRFSLSLLR